MRIFIVLSLMVLGWAYYELSGGADFVPETRAAAEQAPAAAPEPDTPPAAEIVTRAEPPAETPLGPAGDASLVTATAPGPTRAAQPAAPEPSAAAPVLGDRAVLPPAGEPAEVAFESAAEALTAEADRRAIVQAARSAPRDLREVAAGNVNMRGGPGTDHAVLATLGQGTELEILEETADGWVRVRATGGGTEGGAEGWMAARLLRPVDG